MQLDVASITVSTVLPFILAIINQPCFSKKAKQIIALISVVLVGIGVPMINGTFDFANILANVGICFASMQSVYAGLNKTGVFDSIMNATSRTTSETLPTPPEDYAAPISDGEEIDGVTIMPTEES